MSLVNASGSGEIVNAASDSQTDADNASQNEGSTGASDVIDEDFSATKKQIIKQMVADGVVAQNNFIVEQNGRNSDLVLRDPSEDMGSFLNASGYGTGAVLMKVRSNASGASTQSHLDESELRKERKRQYNRVSAKMARLRKQEEVQNLRAIVKELKAESSMLKDELLSLCNECGKLKDENDSIVEELKQIYGVDAVSSLEALISDTK
ncbi:hypothetical protein JRO89_XS02G0050300 [Xanthoceras sorbifolium]|uniref:BZIP domain-containing protein n=1 Tax=Xanthoceras sorbifolium TaxID=99658 RepID=A0ABQ8IER3_9ROSI|nr:hypothetical protein JRO89_XS02G0050300 [Xanthoceras sorbifolium]